MNKTDEIRAWVETACAAKAEEMKLCDIARLRVACKRLLKDNDSLAARIDQLETALVRAGVDIDRLTAENAELRGRVPRWIPVDEQMPETGVKVLVSDGESIYKAAQCDDGSWWDPDNDVDYRDYHDVGVITHWMSLPEPPKGDDRDA